MTRTPGKFEVRHKGRRYWATLNGCTWLFWSDHKWPFFHGHYKQTHINRHDAMEKFMAWLPFGSD